MLYELSDHRMVLVMSEAYIVSSDIVYDLHIPGSDQVSDLCLRNILDEIKLTGVESGKHSVLVIHQLECDGFRSEFLIIIVVFIFSTTI